VAAEALSKEVSEEELGTRRLLPKTRDLRRVTTRVAEAVLREARDSNVGLPFPDHEIPSAVVESMWEPRYPMFTPAEPQPTLHEVVER